MHDTYCEMRTVDLFYLALRFAMFIVYIALHLFIALYARNATLMELRHVFQTVEGTL